MEKNIKVAIVDDHKIIADGLERLLSESEIVTVVGKAHSAADSLEMLAAVLPDVLMLDIGLPDGNGIDLCARLKVEYPYLKILMLTSYGELATITRALEAGADGYVLKNSMPEELLDGVRTVAAGGRFLCEEAGAALAAGQTNPMELTRREMELLGLIAEGYTLPQQADKMCLGYNTVRGYRQKLNVKLGAHNTAQLVQNAKALKLV
jgi:DNA-binding NarL/FixJ family response regulator